MESNSLILGRIPGSGSGIRKTFVESFFVENRNNEGFCFTFIKELGSYQYSGDKFYFNKRANKLIKSSNIENVSIDDKEDYKELVILSIYPYTINSSIYYLYEVIEKDILLEHLYLLTQYYGEFGGLAVSRKHISWYVKGLHEAKRFREEYTKITDLNKAQDLIEEYFAKVI